MRKLVILGLAAVLGGSAQAGVYDVALGTLSSTGTGFSNYSGTGGASNVRGATLLGDWSAVVNVDQWSSEAQFDMETGVGSGIWCSGGTTTAPRVGGKGDSTNHTFGTAGTTWNNAAIVPNNYPIDNFWGSGDYNGSFNVRYRQSFGGTQQSTISNAVLRLMTDYINPMTSSITSNSSMFTRWTSLTALTTTTPGQYRYTTTSFNMDTTGDFLVGARFDDGTRYDGYLGLYNGTFDPNNPLVNLIGVDDDGVGGFAAATGGSASMFINLTPGSYTMVYTQFTAGDPASSINVTGFVAGGNPVPEPATIAALGMGGLALLRRRRK